MRLLIPTFWHRELVWVPAYGPDHRLYSRYRTGRHQLLGLDSPAIPVTVNSADPDMIGADHTLDDITDALLTASRLLVAISARSIAQVEESLTVAQSRRELVISLSHPW